MRLGGQPSTTKKTVGRHQEQQVPICERLYNCSFDLGTGTKNVQILLNADGPTIAAPIHQAT